MKLYIIVRNDLSHGLQASQALHAGQLFQATHKDLTKEWMLKSNRVVILQVPNATELEKTFELASNEKLKACRFDDEDLFPTLGAIAIEPTRRAQHFCRDFPLAFQ
jgi:peptidyl-tRNA hydrolase